MKQREIDAPVSVIDRKGFPVNLGWARASNLIFDPSRVRLPKSLNTSLGKFIVFSNSFMFVFELCDNGYSGFLSIAAISLLDRHISSKTIPFVFHAGFLDFFTQDKKDDIKFLNNKNLFELISAEKDAKIIKVDIQQIGHNKRLRGELVLTAPENSDSIYSHSSWNGGGRRLKLLCCSPYWTAEGVMQFENTDMVFYRNKSFGIFYYNRIVRPKSDLHYWAAGCGTLNGKQISFNLGYGMDDCSFGTENAFFIDGKLHKLELVTFHAPASSNLKPWTFTNSSNNLIMTFFPIQENLRSSHFMLHSDMAQQIFGFFSGRIAIHGGLVFYFNKITGMIEMRRTKN